MYYILKNLGDELYIKQLINFKSIINKIYKIFIQYNNLNINFVFHLL